MRQSKQLIPVVASSSSRDKAKGKGTAASGPKHGPLAASGTGSGTSTAMGRSKAGMDGVKRGEEVPSGTHLRHNKNNKKNKSNKITKIKGVNDDNKASHAVVAGHFSVIMQAPRATLNVLAHGPTTFPLPTQPVL